MWINKYIAHSGFCSRREADKLVEEGRVKVNGEIAEKTFQVTEQDVVSIDGNVLPRPSDRRIYLALNKPVGVVVTTERQVKNNILDFVGHEVRIFPIGRMDKESQGLILLTNDGDLVNLITGENSQVEKEYYVRLDKKVSFELMDQLNQGVVLSGKRIRPIRVKRIALKAIRITVTQEKRRQIRRMFAQLGYRIFKLERTRIMHIHVRGIPPGDWRYLTGFEIKKMFQMLNYHPAMKWQKKDRIEIDLPDDPDLFDLEEEI